MIPHLLDVVRIVMIGAAALAVLLARRLPSHRPVAVLLVAQTGIMLARWALRVLYLAGAIAAAGGDLDAGVQPAPLMGWAHVAGVAYNAAWLADSAALAAAALWCFRPPWPEYIYDAREEPTYALGPKPKSKILDRFWRLAAPALVWVLAVVLLAVTYPEGRPFYPRLFAGAQVLTVVVGLGAAGSWALRAWGHEGLGISRGCILFVVGCEGVTLAGPFVHGVFSAWWLANAVQLVMYSGLILAQGGALRWVSQSR